MSRSTQGGLFTRQTKKYGKVYWASITVNGQRIRKKLVDDEGNPITNKRKAEKYLDALAKPYTAKHEAERRRMAADALRSAEETAKEADQALRDWLMVSDAWDKYLKSPKRPDTGEATLKQYAFQWGQFSNWYAEHYPNRPRLVDVDSNVAEAYAGHLAERQLSASTYNKHIGLLRLVFRILGPDEDVNTNPFDGVTRKKNRQKRANRRSELSRDQLHRLFDAATGELKTLLFLGLYTGQRLGDCCTLQWSNVDISRSVIVLIPSKTASTLENPAALRIPIHPNLQAILENTQPEQQHGDVLPELAKKYRHDRTRVTDRVMALFRKVGINPYKEGTGYVKNTNPETGQEERIYTGKRAVVQYGFHSLRHSAVSFLQEAGIAFAVVQALVGHNSPAITDHYTHVGDTAMATAVRALPSITASIESPADPAPRDRLARLAQTLPLEQVQELIRLAEPLSQ